MIMRIKQGKEHVHLQLQQYLILELMPIIYLRRERENKRHSKGNRRGHLISFFDKMEYMNYDHFLKFETHFSLIH